MTEERRAIMDNADASDGMTDEAGRAFARRGVTAVDGTMKARIERAALELFTARGVDGVSIKELAAEAGVSVGALYRHYESKEALALALFDTIHGRLHDEVKAALEAGGTFETVARRVVRAYCEAADADRSLFAYHLTHMVRFTNAPSPRPDPVALIAARIEAAMDARDIPRGDPEIKAAAALGVVLQPAIHRLAGRFDAPLADRADELARAALAVLRSR
ncbi:TetR/AcrR family transcriptional regulator [Glycocaulis profundi]|nr:TetR/AcrR family transcriptional regulator [Glycocaulis profundi]